MPPLRTGRVLTAYPLFWALSGMCAIVCVAPALMLTGSLLLADFTLGGLHDLEVAWPVSAVLPGGAVGTVAPNPAQTLRQIVESRQSQTLLLQCLCMALTIAVAVGLARRGWTVLVRRVDRALSLLPAGTPVATGDEMDRLTQALIRLAARRAGTDAEADWQRGFNAELARRNAEDLHCLNLVAELLESAPPSGFTMTKALDVLVHKLGANAAALQLGLNAQRALHSDDVVAAPRAPVCLAEGRLHAEIAAMSMRQDIAPDGHGVRSLVAPIRRDDETIALLVVEGADVFDFDPARVQLVRTVARLIALALVGVSRGHEERRAALLEERAAIARELHDSLAQSLAFLKIQVARMQVALREAPGSDTTAAVAVQVRDGVSSVYRQVKELIAAFRVQMGSRGLVEALHQAVAEFGQKSGGIAIALDIRIEGCRLTVNEEFHLLQVVREALSNTVRHARATHVEVSVATLPGGAVLASVDDDGKGFTPATGEIPHYGLAIMRERAQSLGGQLQVLALPSGGTRVCLEFVPESMAPERAARGL